MPVRDRPPEGPPAIPTPGSDPGSGGGALPRTASRATVVVSDLKGSTALAERLDPESLREVLGRYFDEMRVVLEAHGGRFEKVIGDAIVAVFGLDDPDEDAGAMRAVAAAGETRAVLATLNDQLERRWGIRLVTRTGVCTGEVIVGMAAGDRVITGEAIETATRMEQAAPPLEVLLAAATYEVVRDRVRAVPYDDPEPDGPSAEVRGYRLDAVTAPSAAGTRARRGPDASGAQRETRRTVTIVFADARVAAGVAIASPEAKSDAVSRYFAVVREILERHGGTVERYIGDAVMAVFGLEHRHEDDAMRAVRAAVEMRDALAGVNAELALAGAPGLEQRIGVNTGNLVAGDGVDRQRLVTGDAVNVAARLEQTAASGEVVIGDLTARLVGGGAVLEPMEPLVLKGKAYPVPAFRVLEVATSGPTGGLETPMVGRAEEFARLRGCLDEVGWRRAPRLVVVLGEAGVGKSRLTSELTDAAAAEGALILRGRCLSYGEGITFWPVVEILHQAAGITAAESATEARGRLRSLAGEEPGVADRLASLIGLSDVVFPLPELFWAVGRLLAVLGRSRTVVVQVDDAHWAEPTLGELIAHLATATETPLLIVLTARSVLRERHGDLLEEPGCEVVDLAPLGQADAEQVILNVLGDGGLPRAVSDRIVTASAGNPLFVEQLVSMLVDSGRLTRERGRWRVLGDPADLAIPPSIEALVAVRIDELPVVERAVLEPASVIGGEFSTQAVGVLAAETVAPRVPELLRGLSDRQMVSPISEPDGPFDHRFTHPMICEVTYEGMLKRVRADLHERLVDWVELSSVTGDRAVELEEVLGYHLEQAHRYRRDLGPLDDHGRDLGRRAAERLGAAGRRALERGDMPAAANLLRRASGALPDDHGAAARLLVYVGQAEWATGRFADADATLERASRRALAADLKGLASIARLERARLAYITGTGGTNDEVAAHGEGAVYAFAASGDDEGLATAWRLIMNVRLTECRFAAAEYAAEKIVTHATRAGDRLLAARTQRVLAILALCGPLPVEEAVGRCTRILDAVAGDRQAEAVARRSLAYLRAMRGELDVAREECRRCRAELEEIGWMMDAALVSLDSGPIALLAGDPVGAEAELRRDLETLDAMGERNFISTTSALLAEALYRQDRLEEAAEAVAFSREVAAEGDVATHIVLGAVHGKLLVRAGDPVGGIASCRQAVALAEGTDDLTARGYAQTDLAQALRLAGDLVGARMAFLAAHGEHAAKGNLVAVAAIVRELDTLIPPAGGAA